MRLDKKYKKIPFSKYITESGIRDICRQHRLDSVALQLYVSRGVENRREKCLINKLLTVDSTVDFYAGKYDSDLLLFFNEITKDKDNRVMKVPVDDNDKLILEVIVGSGKKKTTMSIFYYLFEYKGIKTAYFLKNYLDCLE